ncbi:MAG: hypothetical protein GC154_02850 [bacterium]|nr:hypothetical protein [bacterium]
MNRFKRKEYDLVIHSMPPLWRGLIERDLIEFSREAGIILLIWWLGYWLLFLMTHPAINAGLFSLLAAYAGMRLAGADVMEDAEEFVFSLPPTRDERYRVRFILGISFLMILVLLSEVGLMGNWPQLFWSLFVDSGFTQPFKPEEHVVFHIVALLAPPCVFSITYACASLSVSRELLYKTIWMGNAFTASILIACIVVEILLGRSPTGVLFAILALISIAASYELGRRSFLRKEAMDCGQGWPVGLHIFAFSIVVLTPAAFGLLFLI